MESIKGDKQVGKQTNKQKHLTLKNQLGAVAAEALRRPLVHQHDLRLFVNKGYRLAVVHHARSGRNDAWKGDQGKKRKKKFIA